MKEGQPLVSVVIPVYNGAATIERCLESVLAQRAPFVFEVIVADSSEDDTARIVRERFPWVKLVRLEQRAFPGTARNAAIVHARAPFVAMTDADCVAAPDWLARMIEQHDQGGYAAVGGAICNGTPFSPSGFVGYMLEFREFIPKSPRRDVITIPTANLCCRREIFDRFGYFDDVRASEDILFNWRLVLAGEKILFDPKIRVTHLNRTGFAKIIKYQAILGHGSATARQIMNPPFEVLRVYPALGWLLPYLMKYPRLGVLVPPVRLGRALSWLAKYDWPGLLLLLLLWPAYLAGAFMWARAFVRALKVERRGDESGPAAEPGGAAVPKEN